MDEVTESQIAAFRARRSQLTGPGAPDPVAAARDILGAQAQVLAPALHSLALRTRGRPDLEAVRSRVHETRDLVHTWGQRDTLHLYDPADWPLFTAAWQVWSRTGRRGLDPPERAVEQALVRLRESGPLTRSGVTDLLPRTYVDDWLERFPKSEDAVRFAAGRLFWALAHRGDACVGPMDGREQSYAARDRWFPDLAWGRWAPDAAAAELTRRYLHVHGPATPNDVAHFFGATVARARRWLEQVDGLVEVRCGGRGGLLLHEVDLEELRRRSPAPALRFLPKFDTLLMAHADKSWTVPEAGERKLIWLRFADIAAVVLAGGKVVGTWRHKATKRRLAVVVTTLSGWKTGLRKAVESEAGETARMFGCAEVAVEWAG